MPDIYNVFTNNQVIIMSKCHIFALCDPKKEGQLKDMGSFNAYLITTNIKILS
jgi:hypothetical protein